MIYVLNGPNLNRLGLRQPEVYGSTTFAQLEKLLQADADKLGIDVEVKQTNAEGELLEWIHRAADEKAFVILNAGALTHTSVAVRDACAELADSAGFLEVHISNVHAREEFRHHSYLSGIARGVIVGLGIDGYRLALRWCADNL